MQNDITLLNGKKIRLRHVQTSKYLHSHPINYTNQKGSKQQEVTCYYDKDDNDFWIVMKQNCGQNSLADGDMIILKHFKTGKNLHSHKYPAPITSAQSEICCFPQVQNTIEGDAWFILNQNIGKELKTGSQLKLLNRLTGLFLHSHPIMLNTGSKQQEVTGFRGGDYNDLWEILDIVD
ncbi:Dolichyl-phosphate-mannose--protein mannosyltransferase 1 [Paramecium bursaria]